jgi:hypothetical protein
MKVISKDNKMYLQGTPEEVQSNFIDSQGAFDCSPSEQSSSDIPEEIIGDYPVHEKRDSPVDDKINDNLENKDSHEENLDEVDEFGFSPKKYVQEIEAPVEQYEPSADKVSEGNNHSNPSITDGKSGYSSNQLEGEYQSIELRSERVEEGNGEDSIEHTSSLSSDDHPSAGGLPASEQTNLVNNQNSSPTSNLALFTPQSNPLLRRSISNNSLFSSHNSLRSKSDKETKSVKAVSFAAEEQVHFTITITAEFKI